jgi:alpha-beta hydrolase superfamily lysophospholipase
MNQTIQLKIEPTDVIVGVHHAVSHTNNAIVYVHGLGGHRGGEKSEALGLTCRNAGVHFIAFDFRGHGDSSSHIRNLTASRLLEDLDAIRSFLAERGIQRFGMVGSSMGGFATAWFALQHPECVAGCVLLAPAFRFVQRRWEALTPEQREEWRIHGTWPLRNDWLDTELGYALVEEHERYTVNELTSRWATPTIIMHGLQDDIVPAADSLNFVNAATYPHIELRLWKAGDHRLTAFKDEIAETSVTFLLKCLRTR